MVGRNKAYRKSKPFPPVQLEYPLPLPPPVSPASRAPRLLLGLLNFCLVLAGFNLPPAESPHEQGVGRAPGGLGGVRGLFSGLGAYR